MTEGQFRSCDAVTLITVSCDWPWHSHGRRIRSKSKSVYENIVKLHAPSLRLMVQRNICRSTNPSRHDQELQSDWPLFWRELDSQFENERDLDSTR